MCQGNNVQIQIDVARGIHEPGIFTPHPLENI